MNSSTNSLSADRELSRSIVTLLLKEPFDGHLLGGINRRVGFQVATAAVALTPVGVELLINPDFFIDQLKAAERVAVVKHEVLHLVFRHLYRPLINSSNQAIFNIAADLVVNQHVAPWPLPRAAITLATFPDLDLSPNQTLEYYYEELHALLRQVDSGKSGDSPCSAQALSDLLESETMCGDHDFWAMAGGFGFQGRGCQGADSMNAASPVLSDALRKALESDGERKLLRARERTNLRQWGQLPEAIRSEVQKIDARYQPRVDWRRVLRLFVASGYRTRIISTKMRMSRRFQQFPGIRIRREQRIAVVIDTSGSIDESSLSLFFGEVHGIWKTGAELLILECDAQVQRSYPYQGKTPTLVQGGGGTDFDPAFEWINRPEHGKFDACIYLTDGYGPKPEIRVSCPVLWVLISDLTDVDHLPGRVISLDS